MTIARSSCTPLWRALSNGWEEFLSNIAWSVGNGNSIRLYSDIWVPTLGPLYQHALANPNSLDALSISDFVNRDGTWSMPMLHRHFNAPAIAHIIGIRCPDPLDVAGRAMWRWTSQHTFALKSAYMHLASSHWPPRQTIWKLIWRMAIPQRLRLFLWLAYQHKIMTNATRYCRNLAPSPTCPLCGNLPESVLHTLRDCVDVRHLWSQILPDAVQHCRQAIDLIYSNVASSSMLSLVRDITRLRRMDWEINIIWVPRDTNRAADIMAKLADTSDFSLRFFTDAPPEVVSFIKLDKSRL
ncbi:hypothetical protein V6N11_035298 [Hibiscus sabdariffa]|uniref:Reverse transcriptase zinc-binding domain-containing protein n=1 Tax=Hibiscus sabdariffa TaxID=183260 RepID=A0ABR2QZT8_9ROSI